MSSEATKRDLVDAGGHKIAFTRAGRGPAVVLIHGIPTNGYLGAASFRHSLRQALKSSPSTFSATAHPTSPLMPTSGSKLSLVSTRLKDPVWDRILGAADFDLKRSLTKRFTRGMVHAERITPEMNHAYERPFQGVEGRLAYLRAARALRTEELSSRMGTIEKLELPTLIVWGAEDTFQPLKSGEHLAQTMPNGRFVVIQQAGHFLPEVRSLGSLRHSLRRDLPRDGARREPGTVGAKPIIRAFYGDAARRCASAVGRINPRPFQGTQRNAHFCLPMLS